MALNQGDSRTGNSQKQQEDSKPQPFANFADEQLNMNKDRQNSGPINMSQEAQSQVSNQEYYDMKDEDNQGSSIKPKNYHYFLITFILLYVVFSGLLIAANIWAISQQ